MAAKPKRRVRVLSEQRGDRQEKQPGDPVETRKES